MLNRNYGDTNFLTGIRAIAIILVFLIHSGGAGLRELGTWGNFIVDCGKYGVQIFFVISGFTIFSQFFKENYTFKKFILVRISRISLPYFPIIVILFLWNLLGGHQFNEWAIQFNHGNIDIWNLLAHFSYISAFNLQWQNTIIGVEWTLGIEVFFYFIFGALIAFNVVNLSKRKLFIFGIICSIISALTIALSKFLSIDPLFVHWSPFRYFVMFFLGGLGFVLRGSYKKLELTKSLAKYSDISILIIAIGFICLSILSAFKRPPESIIELYFTASTFLIVIVYRSTGSISKYLSVRPLIFLGSISFSFYLLHYIVLLITPTLSEISIIDFAIKFLITGVISYFWCQIFEKILYLKVKSAIKN